VSDVMDEAATQERWGLGCVVVDLDGQEANTPENRFERVKTGVLSTIARYPQTNGSEAVRARTGGRAADVRQAVRELLDEGLIRNVGTTTRPRLELVRK